MSYSYPILSNGEALNAFDSFKNNISFNANELASREGVGPDIVADVDFNTLLKELNNEWNAASGQRKAASFEAKASAIVHKNLLKITPYVATDPRFWLWITFVAAGGGFKDLVKNRFGGVSSASNYGFDNLPECLFFRLWWRGYKMSDEDYNFAKRGDIDLWRSHLIRVEISFPDIMAKSFLEKINPLPGQTSTDDQEFVRKLAPKLKARHASCAFETLSSQQCTAIINELEQEIQNEGS